MSPTLRAPVLVPGVATGIGSLPHADPDTAAELVLRCLPELPAVPQLPGRDPREGMLAQWLVRAARGRGRARRIAHRSSATPTRAPECVFDEQARSGLLAFLERASPPSGAPVRVKAQVTGPADPRYRAPRRRHARTACIPTRRGGDACVVGRDRAARRTRACPTPGSCCSSTNPRWSRGDAATRRSTARPRSTCCRAPLAAVDCVTGVHVCGDGDLCARARSRARRCSASR